MHHVASYFKEVSTTSCIAKGDGGVMYDGMALWGGYGMSYIRNFVHHSLEVPGLHGRGGM